MPTNRITDDQKARIEELRKDGWTLREISHETGVSVATCSRHLNRAGIVGDTSRTVEAARARFEAAQTARYDLICDLFDDLENLRTRLNEPYDEWLNGPDGPTKVTLPEPPLSECARITEVMRRTVAEISRLEAEFLENNELDSAKSFLQNLQSSLEAAVALAGPDNDPLNYDSDYSVETDPEQQVK